MTGCKRIIKNIKSGGFGKVMKKKTIPCSIEYFSTFAAKNRSLLPYVFIGEPLFIVYFKKYS
jgi:hypothetical protein